MAGSRQLKLVTNDKNSRNMAEGSSTSSRTDSSNTLTFGTPIMTVPSSFPPFPYPGHANGIHAMAAAASAGSMLPPPSTSGYPALLEALRGPGSGARHVFLQPPQQLPAESLQLVKDTLEGFAGTVSDLQLEQLRAANKAKSNKKKRKRGGEDDGEGDDKKIEVLKMRKVVVDGFQTGQVWQQAKRIIASALEFSERAVEELEGRGNVARGDIKVGGNGAVAMTNGVVSGSDVDSEDEESVEEDDFEDFGEDEDEEDMDGDDEDGVELEDQDEDDDAEDYDDEPQEEYVEDPNGLNDGFFSIEDFNRLSQWFEDQDNRGDPNTDKNSDDEDIDWDADPLAAPAKSKSKTKAKNDKSSKRSKKQDDEADQLPLGMGEDEEYMDDQGGDDSDSEEDGPTFGNMDLYAPEGASDDEDNDFGMGGDEDELNANDVYYRDFFAPPPRKVDEGSRRRRNDDFRSKAPDAADVERAMRDVRHNLYGDLSEQEGSDEEDDAAVLSDVSAGDPRSRRSAHDRRQAKIAEEIRKLEAELVAKRAWTLSGEAMARDRPVNSLLEEHLDFEHAGRAVPVVTTEVTESLDALIKRRILAQEFDEVLRRRPDASTVSATTRRGLITLDDAKSSKGLAEIYEDAHVKAADPGAHVSASDEKLRQEEREVERLWRDVCGKLDALASWNYRPKNPEATVTVVADVAAISMEDAQPSTATGIVAGAETVLAPQEVYRPGADDDSTKKKSSSSEVALAKSGLPLAKAELSREDKTRRRRREKERKSKEGAGWKSAADVQRRRDAGDKESKGDTVAQLKRGGVAVINKKGELVGVDGKKAKAPRGATASNFKL